MRTAVCYGCRYIFYTTEHKENKERELCASCEKMKPFDYLQQVAYKTSYKTSGD